MSADIAKRKTSGMQSKYNSKCIFLSHLLKGSVMYLLFLNFTCKAINKTDNDPEIKEPLILTAVCDDILINI
jgi:hypothetical protein